MKIFTSYFANLKNIPSSVVPISICVKTPYWFKGAVYKQLSPKPPGSPIYNFFDEWQISHDYNDYVKHFSDEVLSNLNLQTVLDDLYRISGGKDVVLICYEKPGDFCHRHLIADWFIARGIMVKEFYYPKKTKSK